MKLGFIVYSINDSDNITNTTANILDIFPDNDIYLSICSNMTSQWNLIDRMCTPCCGEQNKINQTTENYTMISRNNLYGIQHNSNNYICETIDLIKNKYDLLFIIRAGVHISRSSVDRYVQSSIQNEIGAVYSDFDDVYLRAFNPIYKLDTENIYAILIKNKYINSLSNFNDCITSIYNRSIIKHIPENLYSLSP